MLVKGGDRVVLPISFSAYYAPAGLLVGTQGAGIIQYDNKTLSGFTIYCKIVEGNYFDDLISVICVGI